MKNKSVRVLCAICHRLVPVRKDQLVQAHLAVMGKRAKCAGSGMPSARMEEQHHGQAVVPVDPWANLTPAQQFNAADAWALVDALYEELESMKNAHAASAAAVERQGMALDRAWETAQTLAPLGVTWATDSEGE